MAKRFVDLVVVPRAQFVEAIWSKSWEELVAMAERGEHGLSAYRGDGDPEWQPATAYLRNGDGAFDRGRAWLLKQTW